MSRAATPIPFALLALVLCIHTALAGAASSSHHATARHHTDNTASASGASKKTHTPHGMLTPQRAQQAIANTLAHSPAAAIENATALDGFFNALDRLERDPARTVHVLHFGDSHTAADFFTGAVRNQMQRRFGDGGLGYSYAGRPFAGYRDGEATRSMSEGWQTVGTRLSHLPDAELGLAGVGVECSQPDASLGLEIANSRAAVQYLIQPGGGSFELASDPAGTALHITQSSNGKLAAGNLTLPASAAPLHLTLRTRDAAKVRIFGWVTENPQGITWEALGINGAQVGLMNHWDESLQKTFIAQRAPSLIVLAYGTNEAIDTNQSEAAYRESFGSIIGRIKRIAPASSILVIGPPDSQSRARRGWSSRTARLELIMNVQRSICKAEGCAYWNQYKRMGATASMARWAVAGWAQPDHTHFTAEGYRRLAEAFSNDFLQAFAHWQGAQHRRQPAPHHH